MAKRANKTTNTLGLPAYNLPNGTIYRPTASAGAQGSYAANNPVKFGSAKGGMVSNQQLEQQRVQQLSLQKYGFQTPTSTTAFVPQYQGFQTPTSSTPFLTVTGFQTPTSSTPANKPVVYSANYMNPALVPPKPAAPARPQGTYTGDPNDPNTAAWKNYWNAAAANPSAYAPPPTAPKVMTRDEIWMMKHRARQKKMGQETQVQVQAQAQPPAQWAGSYYSTIIGTGNG